VPHFHHLKLVFSLLLPALLSLNGGGLAMAQQGASASGDVREASRSSPAQAVSARTPDTARARPAAAADALQGSASSRPADASRTRQASGPTQPTQGASRKAPARNAAATQAARSAGATPQAARRTGAAAQAARQRSTGPERQAVSSPARPQPQSAARRPAQPAAPAARPQPAAPAARPQPPAAALAATTGALSTAALAQPDRTRPAPQIRLPLHSSVALVVDQQSGEVLLDKNPREVLPIASITKLMTAMVVLDARQRLDEPLRITREDIDTLRHSGSRLRPGVKLTRGEMLQLALMASENRAANALGRHYPGGMPAFVSAMNAKAKMIGMHDSRFVEPTGLSSRNASNGHDLARLVREAWNYPLIRQYSVARSMSVRAGQQSLGYFNTNRLVSTQGWTVGLQKTGYISDAGNCLVMQARIDGRPLIFVLLDANGAMARFGDAQRIRSWLQNPSGGRYTQRHPPPQVLASSGS